jgi:hypothetical protein
MGERIGRIGQIDTDFLIFVLEIRAIGSKKSVCIRPIRSIRSPIVSPFFKMATAVKLNFTAVVYQIRFKLYDYFKCKMA